MKNTVISELQKVLENYTKDLRNTWVSILKTHIHFYTQTHGSENFTQHHLFQEAELLPQDLLENTTVGEASILYEYSLAYTDHTSRKNQGQYFTPDHVATFLASKTLTFPKGVWLDPCSGVGNLSAAVLEHQDNPEQFLLNNLILQDVDPLALLIARTLFALKYQRTETNYFDKIGSRFVVRNFLTETSEPHDYVIANPPYLNTTANPAFKTAKTRDLYAYFLERIIETSKGYVTITPQSYLNSGKFDVLRELIFNNYQTVDFYSFDNMPDTIFKGFKYGSQNTNTSNSVRASIMVAQKTTKTSHRSTGMLRWVAAQRPNLFTNIDEELELFTPTTYSALIPKIGKGLSEFYADTKTITRTLKDIISSKPTEHKLIVPGTPRYFISAVKRTLNRSSYHTLYFDTPENLHKAYLLLNSSYMYWWWRVNDGGMTVSKQTLHTLPLRDVDVTTPEAQTFIAELTQSEQDNLVVKKNANLLNENVKHPMELVQKLNIHLYGEQVAKQLLITHQNSFMN